MRAGAGKVVSGKPLSKLTYGEEGGGEDAGDDIWTEMDADGRWWGRRRLLLAGMAVLGFGLRLGLRCALRHIDDDLYSSSESSGPAGSRGGATRRR